MYFKHSSFQKSNENPLIFFTRHMTVPKLNKFRLRTSKRARSWHLTLPSCTCSTRRAPCPTARTASAQSSFQCPASGAPPSCSARQSAGWNFSIIIYAKLIMSTLSRDYYLRKINNINFIQRVRLDVPQVRVFRHRRLRLCLPQSPLRL
jgi:hypothetical protein